MQEQVYTFRARNWKSFPFIYCIGILFLVLIYILRLRSGGVQLTYFIFLVVILLFSGFWKLFTKIAIGPGGIVSKGPFHSYTIRWAEIQSSGVYVKRYLKRHLLREDGSRKFFSYGKRAWLSKERANLNTYKDEIHTRFMEFDYDEKGWELIQHYLRKD